MRNLWIVVTVAMLLSMAGAVHADSAMDALKATVESLQKQLADALERIKALEAVKAPAPTPTPAPTPADPPKASWADKVLVTAYAHLRWEGRQRKMSFFPAHPDTTWPRPDVAATDEFLIRRLYLNLIAKPNPRTMVVLALRRLGPSPQSIDLEGAFVNYCINDQWDVEFGRVYNKFGWDTWESSSKRLVLDRFAAGEGYSNAGIRGLYANGPTDMGVYVTRKPQGEWEPRVHLGLFNGNFIDPENNAGKSYSIDLRWDRKDWHWGASWIDGTYTDTGAPGPAYAAPLTPPLAVPNDRTMLGLYLRKDPTPWGIQAEYVDGQLFGYDVNGWYGQGSYCFNGKGTAYVRYEEFEPTESPAVPGDLFHAWRIGYAHQLDKNNELTLEYMPARRGMVDVGQFGFQWQTGF